MRFALVSNYLPPSPSGQATMIHRLLRDLAPCDYALISQERYPRDIQADHYAARLPGRYHRQPGLWLARGSRFGLARVRNLANFALTPLGIILRAGALTHIVRQEHCAALVACTGDLWNLPAGYLASRWAGIAFFPYLFDYYSYQWMDPSARFWANRFEPTVLRGATGVIVPNEFLRDELASRYGIRGTVIHNACDPAKGFGEDGMPAERGNEIRIVYTGALYEVNYAAFRDLIAAIKFLERSDVKLHLYTDQPPDRLERENICGPVVFHNHVAPAHVRQVQRDAEILFLPLALSSSYPAPLIRTSAPGKMGEYLAAGRPVLAYAPQDSFVHWYFDKYQVGKTVARRDPRLLAHAIRQILDQPELSAQWTGNALERARADFDLPTERAKFLSLLNVADNAHVQA